MALLSLVIVSTTPMNFYDGEISSVFLRPTSTPVPSGIEVASNLCILQMADENVQEMSQSEYTPTRNIPANYSYHDTHYIVGDINNDGVISLLDYNCFLNILQIHSSYTSNTDVTTYLTSSDAPGLLINDQIVGTQVIFKVGDVNNDGVINSTDANLLYQYYIDDLLGLLTGNETVGAEWIARFLMTSGTPLTITLDSNIPV